MKIHLNRFQWFQFLLIIFLGQSYTGFCSISFQSHGNDNLILKPNIKTVLFYKDGFELATPVLILNSPEKIKLSFDDLDADLKPYKFTIMHCESDWMPSTELQPIDYIDGYNEDNIDDFSYSFNTTVHYTHYSLIFPSANLKPKISGNYIIKVYISDPSEAIFTWRFMVLESTPLGISGNVHQANNIADRLTKQQIDFNINYNGMRVDNPGQNIKVVITQNERQDNSLRNIQPSFARGESLEYSNNDAISFDGGNEFRSFDTKSLIYQTERIRTIQRDESGIHVDLLNDTRRTFKNYATEKDINGRKLIKSEDHAQNSDIEADYAWVSFTLPYQAMLGNGEIFLMGALTDWQLNENSRMTYNFEQKSYVMRLLLKQGHYDYLYLFIDKISNQPDISLIEGSHWETENEYTIWVYYRSGGDLYDRLVGLQNLNSIH